MIYLIIFLIVFIMLVLHFIFFTFIDLLGLWQVKILKLAMLFHYHKITKIDIENSYARAPVVGTLRRSRDELVATRNGVYRLQVFKSEVVAFTYYLDEGGNYEHSIRKLLIRQLADDLDRAGAVEITKQPNHVNDVLMQAEIKAYVKI